MVLKDDILEIMPIGVELNTRQIAESIYGAGCTSNKVQRCQGALSMLAKWDKVIKTGETCIGRYNTKVAVWMRI